MPRHILTDDHNQWKLTRVWQERVYAWEGFVLFILNGTDSYYVNFANRADAVNASFSAPLAHDIHPVIFLNNRSICKSMFAIQLLLFCNMF